MESEFNKELCGERHTRIEARLDKHGAQIDSLEKCTIKLTQMVEKYNTRLDEYDERIRVIEKTPGRLIGRFIGYTVSALLGGLAA